MPNLACLTYTLFLWWSHLTSTYFVCLQSQLLFMSCSRHINKERDDSETGKCYEVSVIKLMMPSSSTLRCSILLLVKMYSWKSSRFSSLRSTNSLDRYYTKLVGVEDSLDLILFFFFLFTILPISFHLSVRT